MTGLWATTRRALEQYIVAVQEAGYKTTKPETRGPGNHYCWVGGAEYEEIAEICGHVTKQLETNPMVPTDEEVKEMREGWERSRESWVDEELSEAVRGGGE